MKRETKQPDIPIVNNPSNELKELRCDLDRHENDLRFQKKLLDWTFGLMVAIVIVCFIGFMTFLLDAWRYHQESYKEFNNLLRIQQELILKK